MTSWKYKLTILAITELLFPECKIIGNAEELLSSFGLFLGLAMHLSKAGEWGDVHQKLNPSLVDMDRIWFETLVPVL